MSGCCHDLIVTCEIKLYCLVQEIHQHNFVNLPKKVEDIKASGFMSVEDRVAENQNVLYDGHPGCDAHKTLDQWRL
ncbi:hypothetical protein Y1Q_0015141 [Alligator mississippiensis]|uniref:Uncharacterized protein n=1 Tax=Alligator mississippiensis TaxID=8496 RepID=A0A151P8X2_ALLMI|nr:hypothetical protein Y1Q_0015141 [Alligator mississippiensis]